MRRERSLWSTPSQRIRRSVILAGLLTLSGCVWLKEDRRKQDLGVDPNLGRLTKSAAYQDTIGSSAYYEGLSPMRVRGYGLVVGLGKNGSRDCPRPIYDRLVESLYKQHRFASTMVGVASITPEELIHDLDTAVVLVEGEIPPAAVKGTPFDAVVSAVAGTETKSLRGGRLYTAELDVFRPVSATAAISGQTLARATGPLFMNPFTDAEAATQSGVLQGTVLGGGEATTDRRIRLVLTEPSYPRARQIQDRINAQFPGPKLVADATSPSLVQLRLPEEYHQDAAHFLALVSALYLSRDPQFEAVRSRALAQELLRPDAQHTRIALALEGLGRSALPVLDDLYTHPKDEVSFHAAVAGLRLSDHVACDAMIRHAQDAACAFRHPAIRALGEAEGIGAAGIALRKQLEDADPRIRVAAYEALLRRRDPSIRSIPIDEDNFFLDQVASERFDNVVYAKRSGARRIALFGRDLRCTPPVFYRSPDGSVTLNADADDASLTVLRVAVSTGTTSSPLEAPLDLPALIHLMGSEADVDADGKVLGLGLDYAAVVRALWSLCRDGSIHAGFVLEQPNVADVLGPLRRPGRPESEL